MALRSDRRNPTAVHHMLCVSLRMWVSMCVHVMHEFAYVSMHMWKLKADAGNHPP